MVSERADGSEALVSNTCEGCDGSGVRCPATPQCILEGVDMAEWTIVERCDTCERFRDDLDAAEQVFVEAKWVPCPSGGWHAVGRTAKSRAVF